MTTFVKGFHAEQHEWRAPVRKTLRTYAFSMGRLSFRLWAKGLEKEACMIARKYDADLLALIRGKNNDDEHESKNV
jgi:hypothetical protein